MRIRGPSIKLVLLTFAALVLASSAAIGGLLLYTSWVAQRELMQSQLLSTARTLAHAIDRDLQSGIRRLQAITTDLEEGPREAERSLYERAQALLRISPEMRVIALNRSDGHQVWNTRYPLGYGPLPQASYEHEQQALRTNMPVVSDVYRGRHSQVQIVSYIVPIQLGSQRYVLVASLDLQELARSLAPAVSNDPDAVGGLLDRQHRFVTRTRDVAKWVGQAPSPQWYGELRRSGEGVARVATLEGLPSYSAWTRLPLSGYTLGIALPARPWEVGMLRSLAFHFLAILLLAASGAAAAVMLGRRLTRDVDALRRNARALVAREPFSGEAVRIAELAHVQEAMVQSARTLTEQDEQARELEAARTEALARAESARKDAEDANKVKDEFLGVLGHEMRNPLAAIMNAAMAIERKNPPGSETRRMAEIAGRQAQVLARLVNDLLEVGRLMGDKVAIRPERLDLATVVETTASALKLSGTFERHHLTLELEPVWVRADAVRMGQVVVNLLTNAVRYTPEGGDIRVIVAAAGGAPASHAVLQVSDTGLGIAAEDIQRIFDLFVQAGSSSGNAGLGVGLSVVKRLVELHGGSIAAASEGVGKGASFTIRLPLADAEASQEPRVRATDSAL